MDVRLRSQVILQMLVSSVIFTLALTSTTAYPMPSRHADQTPTAPYLEALQTANAFLWAWVTRNADDGLRLVSDRLRTQSKDESWLRQFVVGLSNPHHQAFEIGRGRRKNTSRYAFPVTLYEFYTGEKVGSGYRGMLELVKQGGTWRVDHLPESSENR